MADGVPGGRPVVCALGGMVAAAHPLASQAGVGVLAGGGTAFDAAVAVAAALNVVEPFMSGLAGMGYATMWVTAEQRVRVLDFVPPIPRSFPVGRFSSRQQLVGGPSSVGIPGNLAGWCALHAAYGRLGLDAVLAPAIGLAEGGFGLTDRGAGEIGRYAPILSAAPDVGAAFAANYPFSGGAAPGQVFRQPDLGATLRQVGADGPASLYGGALGQRVVGHLAAVGGFLELADLAEFAPAWREPCRVTYRDLVVHVPPPPCEGFQFLLTLRLLEGFDVAGLGSGTADHFDLVVRAVRLAAAVRIAEGAPTADRLAELLADPFVAALRDRLRRGEGLHGATEQWMAEAPAGGDPGHTTSFSVADRDGNMVCVTQSLGSGFGSGVVVPGTGICMNNGLYWSDVQPGSPNRAQPGRAMAMCMAPSISTREGAPVLSLGTPGSYGILQTQPQAMVQYLDFGLGLQAAIEAPRGRVWDGSAVEFEGRVDAGVIADLRRRGHDASHLPGPWSMKVGGMQAIQRCPQTGLLTGAADPRRDGYAIGL